MNLEGEHIFKGPRNEVWNMFLDPDVLGSALPGAQSLNKVDDQHYEATMNLRIGPVSGTFSGNLVLSDEKPPESCTLTVDGRGAPGFAKGVGKVHFTDQGDGTTLMKYTGEVNIGGTLASVGQRMIDSVSKSMIKQGFEALDRALEMRLAAKGSGKVVEYKSISEADFAKGVAKDMAGGLKNTTEFRMLMYILPVVAVLIILSLLFRGCTG